MIYRNHMVLISKILSLEDDFSAAEIDKFKQLLATVWRKIITLDLPNIDDYDPSYKGILAFEQDLIDEKV